jgi:hypothetical protein
MAVYTTIDDPGSYFANILTLSGSGATRSVTYGGANAIQPDMVWAKSRDTTYDHSLMDSVRGATIHIKPNTTAGEGTTSGGLTAFNSDGFTMGSDGDWNQSAKTYVYWSWKAGTTSGIATNGSTTITPSAYSFDQTAGISILKFTGNYTNGAKLAHGLGVAPDLVFFKTLDGVSTWGVYHVSSGATKYLGLDTTTVATAYALAFDDTEPDAVNMTLGSWEAVNGNVGMTGMIAYAFTSIKGYSKFGTYIGNGVTDGTFVNLGFKPAYIWTKCSIGGAENWSCFDNKRLGYNPKQYSQDLNVDIVERTTEDVEFYSNGFKLTQSNSRFNGSGYKYVYAAFAEQPFVNSSGAPCNAL